MSSENKTVNQPSPKRSFIEEARRAQIVSAAIETLAELGYGMASLAQVAKRAGISTSLIPYHFKDKDDLLNQTILDISTNWVRYVQQEVAAATTATDKLQRYIEAHLAYMGTRPKHFAALIEITFNARNADGVPHYKIGGADPSGELLEVLLAEGQKNGEFREFDVPSTAMAIRGTIYQFLGGMSARPDLALETYTTELVEFVDKAIQRR